MQYERPAIERRTEVTSPVIGGNNDANIQSGPGVIVFSPTWRR